MDGTGYPRRLKGDEMLLQSRVVAVADVFEALTAGDRPYKKATTLSVPHAKTVLQGNYEKSAQALLFCLARRKKAQAYNIFAM
jgi:HD-GYP domain-containing protein (c-di-GMP phosphodiesterase class II)